MMTMHAVNRQNAHFEYRPYGSYEPNMKKH